MIHKTLSILFFALLISAIGIGLGNRDAIATALNSEFITQNSSVRFSFTEISLSGTSKVPFMRVSWAPAGFNPGEIRIEGYTLTVEFSGNGETGRVVQTPSANGISVSVGLLGIPDDQRIKLFGGSSSISAAVTLKARFIQNGQRKEVTERHTTSFRPLPTPQSATPVIEKPVSGTPVPGKPLPAPVAKPTPVKQFPEDGRKRVINPVERVPAPILAPIVERPNQPRPTPTPTPEFRQDQEVRLLLKNILPIGVKGNPSSVLVSWSAEERLGVKLEGFEVSLELIGDGVNERLTQSTDARSISLAVSLDAISATKRAKIFNSRSGGRINAVVKAIYTIRGQRKTEQAQSSRTVTPTV